VIRVQGFVLGFDDVIWERFCRFGDVFSSRLRRGVSSHVERGAILQFCIAYCIVCT
jgi:hypothetical protein